MYCKACYYTSDYITLNDYGCSRCGCQYCGYSMKASPYWLPTCLHCGKDSMTTQCEKAVNHRIRFKGTNGNEYDKENHGKPLEGEGMCREYHDSHGLYIVVFTDDNQRLAVDPIEIEVLS